MTSGHVVATCVYVIVTSLVQVVPASELASFDRLVRQLMDCRQVPGLVVSAVDLRRGRDATAGAPRTADRAQVVQRQYGWADIDARRPMTVNTRVCVASLTKAFTSTLLGIMLYNDTRHVLRYLASSTDRTTSNLLSQTHWATSLFDLT